MDGVVEGWSRDRQKSGEKNGIGSGVAGKVEEKGNECCPKKLQIVIKDVKTYATKVKLKLFGYSINVQRTKPWKTETASFYLKLVLVIVSGWSAKDRQKSGEKNGISSAVAGEWRRKGMNCKKMQSLKMKCCFLCVHGCCVCCPVQRKLGFYLILVIAQVKARVQGLVLVRVNGWCAEGWSQDKQTSGENNGIGSGVAGRVEEKENEW
ncbi:hypothetical protein VNO80_11343 [Phaseolus coccineus]|uniref:Uncharacterized protein n=1 Tax=Phaseolus coccineus TaxID=3886 RepID=A0AAN9NF15_PHACN